MKHECNICQGRRDTANGVCLGCGTPVANAKPATTKQQARRPRCPKCGGGSVRELEKDRFLCNGCSAVFERDDMGYLDDRPDRNAEKREQTKRQGIKNGGHHLRK